MKPKVLLVGHLPPSAGGITSLLITILNSAINEEFELLSFNIGRPAKKNVANNFGYNVLLNSGLQRAFVAIVLTFWHIATFPFVALWYRPAIVHVHTSPFLVFWETAYYLLVARFLRKPCVLQLHFSFRFFYQNSRTYSRKAILWVLRRATRFVVICKEDVRFIQEKAGTEIQCCYLANFIDVGFFQQSVARARTRAGKGDETVVFFLGGSDAVRKGYMDLVSAIRILNGLPEKLRFLLVAVPRSQVEAALPPELLSSCATQGWVSGDDKIEVFAKSDIFVLPSYGEGMPISILEAMASSMPVIATRVGGIPDMITEGREGHLIDPGDFRGLAQAILCLAEYSEKRKQMGKMGLEKVLSLYDIPVGTQQLKNLYKEILQ